MTTELPRKAAVRTARLAALPLGYAGRSALGLGKRLGGRSAESVLTEVQQRTAEQLFRTLGELKGGAMKFGQALSVLEAALPDELVAPYREHLTALQDSAPSMPAAMAYEEIEDALGPDWRDLLVQMDEKAAAAASIGQVHRGRWHDGREVAVKVQYPGAGDALLGDLRQIARVAKGMAPVFPGIDIKPLVEEVQARAADELDYHLEAEAQAAFADAFRGDPEIVVPDVVEVGDTVLVSEWMESSGSLATIIAKGTREERDHYGRAAGPVPVRRPGADRHAARRPAPRELPDPAERRRQPGPAGRARLRRRGPAARAGRCPPALGRLMRLRRRRRPRRAARRAARARASSRTSIQVDPQQVLRLPRAVRRAGPRRSAFRFNRDWMREPVRAASTTRAPRLHAVTTRSTCRRRTSSSTAPGSAGSACSASSRPRRRSGRSSRSRLPGFAEAERSWESADPEAAAAEPVAEVVAVRGRRGPREPR